ncbi:hypothetical protein ACH9L7_13540 [Haloferax sp. S1W]|uniref:hypothetical protein n=1 Tax=Haloferax sp. S1W TaxID=3377110 RepID=UPI0037CAD072
MRAAVWHTPGSVQAGGTSVGRDTISHDSGTVLRERGYLADMTTEPVCDGACATREPTTGGFGFFFLTA